MHEAIILRPATAADIPVLEVLIPRSVRVLQAPYYTAAQLAAALGPVFGVDRQLIHDGTYFVAEASGRVVGCGGWSRRRTEFGSDRDRSGEDTALDPTHDPARIRAFFVDPDWARRGIGRALLAACEDALRTAGFRTAVLVATLAGEPLYAMAGYVAAERYEVPLPGGLTLPVVRMTKTFGPGGESSQRGLAYFFARLSTTSMCPSPAVDLNSVGRFFPSMSKQAFRLSPSSS
jgi:GNAT superfamily N-acetyltransferase